MQRPPILLTAVAACTMISCRQPSEQPAQELSEADRQAIQSVSDRFQQHLLARNLDSLAALYTDDAVVMPPNHAPVIGRGAIREFQASYPAVTAFSLNNETMDGRGDLAYVRGRYVMTVAGAPTDSGKYIEVRRRQPDGSWRIAVDIFNSNLPVRPTPR